MSLAQHTLGKQTSTTTIARVLVLLDPWGPSFVQLTQVVWAYCLINHLIDLCQYNIDHLIILIEGNLFLRI